MICDNINNVHDNLVINEEVDGIRVICKHCKKINVLRIGNDGRFNNRQYSKVFKADVVQPGSNLYYKLNQYKMSLA